MALQDFAIIVLSLFHFGSEPSKIHTKCHPVGKSAKKVTMCAVLSNYLQELILPRCCRHLFHQQHIQKALLKWLSRTVFLRSEIDLILLCSTIPENHSESFRQKHPMYHPCSMYHPFPPFRITSKRCFEVFTWPSCTLRKNQALPTSASMKFWTNWSISQIPVAAWWGSRWKSRTRRQLAIMLDMGRKSVDR